MPKIISKALLKDNKKDSLVLSGRFSAPGLWWDLGASRLALKFPSRYFAFSCTHITSKATFPELQAHRLNVCPTVPLLPSFSPPSPLRGWILCSIVSVRCLLMTVGGRAAIEGFVAVISRLMPATCADVKTRRSLGRIGAQEFVFGLESRGFSVLIRNFMKKLVVMFRLE